MSEKCDDGSTKSLGGSNTLIDWFSVGEATRIRLGESEVIVHFVGRKGRRCRIRIVAPEGSIFSSVDRVNLRWCLAEATFQNAQT
jgi:hypothetical protein